MGELRPNSTDLDRYREIGGLSRLAAKFWIWMVEAEYHCRVEDENGPRADGPHQSEVWKSRRSDLSWSGADKERTVRLWVRLGFRH
jgi:hypothetical protein